MDILQETTELSKKSFMSHVFNMGEESNAEILNVVQYSALGVVPIVVLNKLIQRFIPEADADKSSLEVLAEIFIQLVVMFGGIIFIHRMITYIPTYSGFKYESLTLTNVILAFLVLVLSIQTKIGIKVNIIYDRLYELWNGPEVESKNGVKQSERVRVSKLGHNGSQADHMDRSDMQSGLFPPAPTSTTQSSSLPDMQQQMMYGGNNGVQTEFVSIGPSPANGVLGGSFGASF